MQINSDNDVTLAIDLVREILDLSRTTTLVHSTILVDPFDQLEAIKQGKRLGFFMKVTRSKVECHCE